MTIANQGAMNQGTRALHLTVAQVLSQVRKHDFAVLATADREGNPHAAGVTYGVSLPDDELAFYVMTRRHLKKVRNIAQNPRVALVIPLSRRLLWFLPPPTIQLSGRAEILDWTDERGSAVFRRFWMGRRILTAYREASRHGEERICFLKITPDPLVATYMVGSHLWEIRKRMESGAAKVLIPPEYLPSSQPRSARGVISVSREAGAGVPSIERDRTT